MKRLLSGLLLVLFLAACNGTVQTIVESQTAKIESPAPDRITPQPTPASTQTVTRTTAPTASPTIIPCDPFESYCVEKGHFILDRPIALPGTITIDRGYPYGATEGGMRDPHHGVEFYNGSGTPVLAAAEGRVVVAGDDSQTIYALNPNTYGNLVILKHQFEEIGKPVFTLYGHLSKVEVQIGQTVRSGEEIGKVGSTGYAVGSHLHFEIRLGQNDYDSDRNPLLWLKPLTDDTGKAEEVLAGRLEDSLGNPIQAGGLNIQYFHALKGPQAAAWQVETYAPEEHPVRGDDIWNENFVLGDIPSGNYRISLIRGGRIYERWFEVFPGQLTTFAFRIDQ